MEAPIVPVKMLPFTESKYYSTQNGSGLPIELGKTASVEIFGSGFV